MKQTKQAVPEIHHIGLLVQDMNKAIEHYTQLGLGPFRIAEAISAKKPDTKIRIGMSYMIGSMGLELIQVVQGNPFYVSYLERHGEGMHHVAFIVDDADIEADKWVKQGASIASRGTGWAYLDFGYDVFIEFLSRSRIPSLNSRLYPQSSSQNNDNVKSGDPPK